jgi:hypothetical protein
VLYEILVSHGHDYEDTVYWDVTVCRLFISEEPAALKMHYTSVYPEDGSSTFLQNVGNDMPDYVVSHYIKQ